MRDLIRRDPARGSLGRWLVIAGVAAAALLNVVGLVLARQPDRIAAVELLNGFATYLVLSLAVAWVLFVDATGERYRRFDITLPLPSRRLWLSHTIVLSIAVVGVTATVGGIAAVLGWALSSKLPEILDGFAGQALLLAARFASAGVLGAVLVQSVAPATSRISGRRAAFGFAAAVAAVSAVAAALRLLPAALVVIPIFIAVLVGRATWSAVSPAISFQGSSKERRYAPVGEGISDGAGRTGIARAWFSFWTMYRALNKMPLAPIVMIPMLLAFGVLLSGVKRAAAGGTPFRFSMVFLVSYMLMASCAVPPMRLFLFDAFPISRRKLFAVSVLPILVLLFIGYGGGRIAGDAKLAERELVEYVHIEDSYHIRVPIEYCSIDWDGEPPESASPWGESHAPWSTSLGGITDAVIYSPFSAPEGSSPEFIALQISRAVAAVYGERVEPESILDHHLEVGEDGRLVPRGGAFSLRGELAGVRPRPLGPVFPVLMLTIAAPWLFLVRLYYRSLRAGISLRTKRIVYWCSMGLLFAVHIAFYLKGIASEPGFWEGSAFVEIVIREWAANMPGGAVGVWVICGLAAFGLYRFAEAEFARIESNPGEEKAMELLMRPV